MVMPNKRAMRMGVVGREHICARVGILMGAGKGGLPPYVRTRVLGQRDIGHGHRLPTMTCARRASRYTRFFRLLAQGAEDTRTKRPDTSSVHLHDHPRQRGQQIIRPQRHTPRPPRTRGPAAATSFGSTRRGRRRRCLLQLPLPVAHAGGSCMREFSNKRSGKHCDSCAMALDRLEEFSAAAAALLDKQCKWMAIYLLASDASTLSATSRTQALTQSSMSRGHRYSTRRQSSPCASSHSRP